MYGSNVHITNSKPTH